MLRILLSFVFLFVLTICQGQNDSAKSDFIEIGFHGSSFSNNRFIENAAFYELMGNPQKDPVGYIPVGTGNEFGLNLKYAKQFTEKFHLVSSVGYSRRIENAICYCHFCDKVFVGEQPLKINSIDAGIGARYSFFQKANFNFSGEGMYFYSFSLNQDGFQYSGFYFSPIIGYDLSNSIQVNVKLIFEKPILKYNKNELPFEIAILKRI